MLKSCDDHLRSHLGKVQSDLRGKNEGVTDMKLVW